MSTTKFQTNALYFGDNLGWMEQWPDESIDLIYLDPPFNSNTNYNMIFGTGAQVRAYDDTWQWGPTAVQDRDRALAFGGALAIAVEGFCKMLPETPMLAYLCHLAPRLQHMHRLLKLTGSLYLHCDDTAGHYIKVLMDAVFAPQNYKNTIIWKRALAHNDAQRFGRITDFILFYTKSSNYTWNGDAIAEVKTDARKRKAYASQDKHGRWRGENLTGAGVTKDGASAKPWKGYDVFAMGRHWAVPKVGYGKYADYIKEHFIPNYDEIDDIHDRLDALDEAGLIHHPKDGKWPRLKRYADADEGSAPQNLILGAEGFHAFSNKLKSEYLGYNTQKPEALLRQFIKASSNPGDVVLDPYCGCGTTIRVCRDIEGTRNGKETRRDFIGIDLTHIAISVVESDYQAKFGEYLQVFGTPEDMESARDLFARNPFQFEAWAVAKVAGLAPNQKKTGDRGVDGRGYVIVDESDKRELVLAQVKGGKNLKPADIRDFIGTMANEGAVLGIFLVMENALITSGMRSAAATESVKILGKNYPKVQIFSVEDRFAGRTPDLPPLINPITNKSQDLLARL